jgi:putative two-component system response regulator
VTRRIPVIFVTASHEISDETKGFACGGVDYITKPISTPIVLARVRTQLALYDQNRALEDKVRERTAEVTETSLEIIRHLGRAAEYRDNETGKHVMRMSHYSHLIALAYGLPHDETELILSSAPMHDLGKIGIPDHILLKPGKLNRDEMDTIKRHCDIGHKIIAPHKSILLKTAATIALTHHEKWDGSGYPRGLKGSDIPLVGRIAAIADVFDALTSKRPYKQAWPVEAAQAEILKESGVHFDPGLVPAFLRSLPEMLVIKEKFAD